MAATVDKREEHLHLEQQFWPICTLIFRHQYPMEFECHPFKATNPDLLHATSQQEGCWHFNTTDQLITLVFKWYVHRSNIFVFLHVYRLLGGCLKYKIDTTKTHNMGLSLQTRQFGWEHYCQFFAKNLSGCPPAWRLQKRLPVSEE